MLTDKTSSAIVAVSDIERAKAFYEGTLGLAPVESDAMIAVYRTGPTHLVVYQSDDVRPGTGNAVVWDAAGDIERIVAELSSRGVRFEHYEMDGVDYRDGIHHAGDFKMVWFKDPDGNVLHVNQMPAG